MKDLSTIVTDQIENERITPIPRSAFVMKNYALWVLAGLSLIAGSISVALVAYNVTARDWDIYHYTSESALGFFVSSLPYLWIGLVVVSLILAVLNVEKSKKGYKYSPILLVLASIALSVILGGALHTFGAGQRIDTYLGNKLEHYQTVEAVKERTWNQPDKGLFSGTITDISDNFFSMTSADQTAWRVNYADATLRGRARVETGVRVKVIGNLTGNNTIDATEIRPWNGGNQGSSNGSPGRHGAENGNGRP